jgi:hypothetical protein
MVLRERCVRGRCRYGRRAVRSARALRYRTSEHTRGAPGVRVSHIVGAHVSVSAHVAHRQERGTIAGYALWSPPMLCPTPRTKVEDPLAALA